MKKTLDFVKKYPLSLLCITAVWYLSIWFLPPDTPLNGVPLMDKWTHFVMYGGTCAVIWWEKTRGTRCEVRGTKCEVRGTWGFAIGCWTALVLMSGMIELIQEHLTDNRSGEWLDFLANAIGCTIGTVVGLTYSWSRQRR